ncbi:MAG: winged helix-turn-helix domain-containing protein [Caldilineaceae bacterium]
MPTGHFAQRIPHTLVGRECSLHEIAQGVLAHDPQSFALVGARLVGKSALLRCLAAEQGPLHLTGEASVVLLDCACQVANSALWVEAYERLKDALRTTQRALDWNQIEQQTSPAHRLCRLARQLSRCEQRLVLLLDNFGAWLTATEPEVILQLRLLMQDLALIVTTEQPLYDLGKPWADEALWDGFTHRFLALIEPEAAEQWLIMYQEQYTGLAAIRPALAELAGRHPFLLRKLGDSLHEVQQMLPSQQAIAEEQLSLVRLRLAEYGRPLFMALWHTLQTPPEHLAATAVQNLLEQLLLAPLPAKQVQPEHFIPLNWLINQAVVAYRERNGVAYYQLFSPLFTEFINSRLATSLVQPLAAFAPTRVHEPEAPLYEQLTKMEAALLRYFLNHSQSVVSPEQLLTEVWKRPDSSVRRVQEAIRRLRLQLEQQTPPIGVIENERGRGYRFIPAQQDYR